MRFDPGNISGGLSSHDLKVIALLSMVTDHVAGALVDWYVVLMPGSPHHELLHQLSIVLHCVGRLSFPLFAFLLVEGFFHTRDRGRYLARLTAFALLSEMPFDLAFLLWRTDLEHGVFWRFEHQNVLFTLAIGLSSIWAIDTLRLRGEEDGHPVATVIACIVAGAAGCVAAWLAHVDYSWQGVAAIEAAYLARVMDRRRASAFAMAVPLALFSPYELFVLLDAPLVWLYDGTRGRSGGTWFFYFFYPAHLLVLGVAHFLLLAP